MCPGEGRSLERRPASDSGLLRLASASAKSLICEDGSAHERREREGEARAERREAVVFNLKVSLDFLPEEWMCGVGGGSGVDVDGQRSRGEASGGRSSEAERYANVHLQHFPLLVCARDVTACLQVCAQQTIIR